MDLEKGHMLAFTRVVLCKFSDVYRFGRRPCRAMLSLVPAHGVHVEAVWALYEESCAELVVLNVAIVSQRRRISLVLKYIRQNSFHLI